MGTRSSTGVVIDGVEKLSYNQFDGYPSGVGQRIVDELLEFFEKEGDFEKGIESLRTKAAALCLVESSAKPSAKELRALKLTKEQRSDLRRNPEWYGVLHADQGSVLARLQRGFATDGTGFPLDSLFCEWAYVVDLDARILEVYQGFQEEEHSAGRFASRHIQGERYYPVALVAAFPLNDLPLNLDEAVKAVLPSEDDEETDDEDDEETDEPEAPGGNLL